MLLLFEGSYFSVKLTGMNPVVVTCSQLYKRITSSFSVRICVARSSRRLLSTELKLDARPAYKETLTIPTMPIAVSTSTSVKADVRDENLKEFTMMFGIISGAAFWLARL